MAATTGGAAVCLVGSVGGVGSSPVGYRACKGLRALIVPPGAILRCYAGPFLAPPRACLGPRAAQTSLGSRAKGSGFCGCVCALDGGFEVGVGPLRKRRPQANAAEGASALMSSP